MSGKPVRDKQEKRSPDVSSKSSVREQANADTVMSPIKTENPPSSISSSAWIGRVIDNRYRIVEMLGEGGMGAVFVAKHLKLDKDVAFKVILPIYAGDGEIAERFAREAMATARFEHPHVASAIDYGTLPEGGAYFVMQLVRGDNLGDLMEKEGPFHWSRAAEIGAQLADALSAAATHGIVHRDLKPENIIIQKREDGSELIKILDFGIARNTRDSIPAPSTAGKKSIRKLTREGAIVGTPGYMSPEQAIGDRVGHAADLYALGVVIWECIAGRQLWVADDISTLIQKQLTEPVPHLRDLLPEDDIPEELDVLILKLLSVRSQHRPEHAGEVRDILRQFSLSVTGAAFPIPEGFTGSSESVQLHKFISSSNTKRTPSPKPKSRISLFIKSSAIIFILLLISFGTYWILDGLGKNPVRVVLTFIGATKGASDIITEKASDIVEEQRNNHRFQKLIRNLHLSQPGPIKGSDGMHPEPKNLVMEGEGKPGSTGNSLKVEGKVLHLNGDQKSGKEASPASDEEKLRPEISTLISPLMIGETRKDRVGAAKRILEYSKKNPIPKYLSTVARLQIAKMCNTKKEVVNELIKLNDPRVLPALEKMSQQRRGGCGPDRRRDCLSCLRQDLSKAINQFENEASP